LVKELTPNGKDPWLGKGALSLGPMREQLEDFGWIGTLGGGRRKLTSVWWRMLEIVAANKSS
jgi:hypothetical protein